MSTGAQVIDTPRNAAESWLLNTVHRQADAAGIRRPEVAIYDSPDVNAFATGPTRNNALVAVSTGLLSRLSEREVEAVLGHEVSHVANGDMVTLTLLQGVVNTFVIFLSRIVGFVVDRVLLRNERGTGPGFFLASLVAQILLGILASMIVMWFSRQREFRADAGGAKLAGRDSMIRRAAEPAALDAARAAAGSDARVRHLGRPRRPVRTAVHVASAARGAHRGSAARRLNERRPERASPRARAVEPVRCYFLRD